MTRCFHVSTVLLPFLLAASATAQQPPGLPDGAEELLLREKARAAVEDALDRDRQEAETGLARTDRFVRIVEDLVAEGPPVVPFLANELNQALPDSYFLCAYALGSIGTPEAAEALRQAIDKANRERGQFPEVRKAWAAFGLGLAGDAGAIDLLFEGRHDSAHVPIYSGMTVVEAIGLLTSPESTAHILDQVNLLAEQPERAMLRMHLLRSLRHLGDPTAAPALLKLAEEPDARHRREVVRALAALDHPEALAAALSALDDGDPMVRRVAALTLESAERPVKVARLRQKLAEETDLQTRGALIRMIGDRAGDDALELLRHHYETSSGMDRVFVIEALENIANDAVLPLLRKALSDGDARVAARAPLAIGSIGTRKAIDLLIETVGSSNWNAVQGSVQELRQRRVTRAAPAISKQLLEVQLAGVLKDPTLRYRSELLADSLVRLGYAETVDELRKAIARQIDPRLKLQLEQSVASLELIKRNGQDVDAWITSSRSPDEETRRLAYERLAGIGGVKAAKALSASFGRVEPDEGIEVLRALGVAGGEPALSTFERVLADPEFDEAARWGLRDMAAWSALRTGGHRMEEALERSVRRRGARDPKVAVYYVLAAREKALPLIEEHRISRLRFIRWTRGEELHSLDRLVRRVRLGRSLHEFDLPPEKLRFR